MAALQLKYDARFAGAKAVAKKDSAQVFDGLQDRGTVYYINAGGWFYLTGYYWQDGYIQYIQTTNGMNLYINYLNGGDEYWSITQDVVKPKTYSQMQAQYLVNKIIENNEQILKNNLVCARYANIFTKEQQQQIRNLQLRLQARNEALQAEGLIKSVATRSPEGYAELEPYLNRLMSGGGVGVASWVVIVVAAMIIAGAGTAVYYAYKSFADESEQDIKYSKELTAILAQKLTPEEYQQLLDETKGIVTRAKIRQAASSYGNILMYAGIAVGGYLVYKLVRDYVVS